MKVEVLKKVEVFEPIEIKLKIESYEELRGLHKLIGSSNPEKTPGCGAIFHELDKLVK